MKERPSKLDGFRDELLAWMTAPPHGEGLTLEAAAARLNERHGVSASCSRLSKWLADQRQREMQERILGQITSGAQMGRDIEKRFEKNPAPETAQLVKLLRVLVMQLSVQSTANPELLDLVNPLMRSILDFKKSEQKAEELALDRERFLMASCEKILKAATDQATQDMARSQASNAEKIQFVRTTYFADVDALQSKGGVTLPK